MAAAREASADINANATTKSTVQLHANGFIHSRMTRARLMHTLICRLVGECCVQCITSQAVSWLTQRACGASPHKQCHLSLGEDLLQNKGAQPMPAEMQGMLAFGRGSCGGPA